MDTSPSLEVVYGAVMTLYHHPDSSEKERASKWLQDLQRSVFSWNIADKMLEEKRNEESCYFAAQTIRSKIKYSFRELPKESYSSLKNSLVEHIRQINNETSAVIAMQLCLAVADLALQMPSWQSPVTDLLNLFAGTNLGPLLQILRVLPEELDSTTLRLGANRKREILQCLISVSNTVLQFLNHCITVVEDTEIQIKILRCCTSWMIIRAIRQVDFTANTFVTFAFGLLSNPLSCSKIHFASTDCLCAVLQVLDNNNEQCSLEIEFFTRVLSLEECFRLTISQDDQEKLANYCRLFTELAEYFLEKMINESNVRTLHYSMKILDLVLQCVQHSDHDVAEKTFGLWYNLSERLYVIKNDSLNLLFNPYIERLIVSLCQHCEMEPDIEGLLEDTNDFVEFRFRVSELINDVVFIPGALNCFRRMFLNLQQPEVTWHFSEATLFVMQAVAKHIMRNECDVVPQVLDTILCLPDTTHIAIRYTSVLLIGELCEWIERNTQSLDKVLRFLHSCLQNPLLSSAAAVSLQQVCNACRNNMRDHYGGLIEVIQFLDTFGIKNDAAIGLLQGVSVTLTKLPVEQIPQAIHQICWLQVNRLNHLVENDITSQRGTDTDPALWFDRLAAVFKHVKLNIDNSSIHPCQTIITEIWPFISKACNKYQGDSRVMERCCRCLRFAIRCVGKQSADILEPLVQQIVMLHRVNHHSCFLYLGSILVDEFGEDTSCEQGLMDMFQVFMNTTLTILQEPNGLRNNPDSIEDLFRLCSRFLQKMPVKFLQSSMLSCVLDCAVFAVKLDHKDANASVMKFFYYLINAGKFERNEEGRQMYQSLVSNLINERGQVLVTTILHASVFCLHSDMFSGIAEVLINLMYFYREQANQWLQLALQSLPTHNAIGVATATQEQLSSLYQSVTTAKSSKEISRALRDFVQLYR